MVLGARVYKDLVMRVPYILHSWACSPPPHLPEILRSAIFHEPGNGGMVLVKASRVHFPSIYIYLFSLFISLFFFLSLSLSLLSLSLLSLFFLSLFLSLLSLLSLSRSLSVPYILLNFQRNFLLLIILLTVIKCFEFVFFVSLSSLFLLLSSFSLPHFPSFPLHPLLFSHPLSPSLRFPCPLSGYRIFLPM